MSGKENQQDPVPRASPPDPRTFPLCPRPFVPAWWCRGPHLQTLWPYLFRRMPRVELRRERLELPDGDFLDLDWTKNSRGPIVIVLHGLEGSSDSKYARGLLKAVHDHGWRGVVMHFRGCSGEPNRLPRSYHSGETTDLAYVVKLLAKPRTRNTALCRRLLARRQCPAQVVGRKWRSWHSNTHQGRCRGFRPVPARRIRQTAGPGIFPRLPMGPDAQHAQRRRRKAPAHETAAQD